jgi:hypothetical protein
MIVMKPLRVVLIAFVLVSCATSGSAQRTSFDDFKAEMMPQVGKTITVEGVLASAKLGWIVEFKDWGVYLHATTAADFAKSNQLDRFDEQTVKVTGKLRYFPQPAPTPVTNPVAATAPEHFYFEIGESTIVSTQKAQFIREAPRKSPAVTTAPEECLRTFRAFFRYAQRPNPSIVEDNTAQWRWLSSNLQQALKQKVATFKDKNDPDFPGNGTFLGFWDSPTTFTILGSRRYENRAVIDVSYSWGKGTNYEGDSRLTYYVFVLEEGRWKLDDMYTFRGKFATAESLNAYLTSK